MLFHSLTIHSYWEYLTDVILHVFLGFDVDVDFDLKIDIQVFTSLSKALIFWSIVPLACFCLHIYRGHYAACSQTYPEVFQLAYVFWKFFQAILVEV